AAPDEDGVPGLQAPFGRVQRVHHGHVGESLLEPPDVVEVGVSPSWHVKVEELEGVLALDLPLPVGKGVFVSLDRRLVDRNGPNRLEPNGLDLVRQGLTVDLELAARAGRSEEHTSELQSRENL